ncbi:hypothetical protein B0I33_10367 [Prauserella shujinwangii]|uniref:Uncharacterized protein n=1 Tax=Prauserella shujinwangii TaxID=1453103 RepID=A0A2T0LY38_9PSEU|nr:hypothetical protein [Prauserella shujinwangii]PRX49034.1 hypothetical protein B0I33_10367 [Prauserella shujinwangii]
MSTPVRGADWALLALLTVDAVLLAVLELLFLPLRLDGHVLPRAGDVMLPLSVLLALVTTPLLVTTAARLVRSRLALVPLLGWLGTLLVMSILGPGGDLLLVGDWRTLALLLGGALPAAFLLGRSLARLKVEAR